MVSDDVPQGGAVPPRIKILQLQLGPMENFVYLVGDLKSKQCAVVDPAWDVPAIFRAVEENGWKLSHALISHNHHDHTNGLAELLSRADVPVHVHREDASQLSQFKGNIKPTVGGDRLRLGGMEIAFLHTPGHTAGSQCFYFSDRLVTGDTLFIGGCGRVDLPTSDPAKMYESLKKISNLPDETVIFPGHNYADAPQAVLEDEKEQNPYLKICFTQALPQFLARVRK